jgi:hypothetical protein
MGLPLEMAQLDAFDTSRALTVSGLDTDTNKLDRFVTNAGDIAAVLTDRFLEVDTEHWSDYATVTDALDSMVIAVQAQDLIVYQDHGGRRGWSSVLNTGDFPLDFLGTHPVVVALACSTGFYDGITSIADSFLDSAAGGYIGSTELSGIGTNCEAGLMLVDRWPAGGVSAGTALRDTKVDLLSGHESQIQRLWVIEYNLYGDPKYGIWPVAQAAAAAAAVPSAPVAPTTLDVAIPDYQVTTSAGEVDTARIPGGLMLLEPGLPMVPIYVVTQSYPKGTRVQDVTLISRSGLTTATGLNLPLANEDPATGSSGPIAAAAGWYPDNDFDWEVEEEPDGTTTLVVRLYPFYYNAATTGVEFYRSYSFDIRVTAPSVEILSIATDAPAYAQGDPVSIGTVISGTSSTGQVIVETTIRRYGSGTLVAGLPLRSLVGLEGLATYLMQWPSDEPGTYLADVTLRTESGDVLDREAVRFTVGIADGEVTGFSVTPTSFDIGAPVALSLTFANTGTVPLTGTALMQIRTAAGASVQEMTHDFSALAPGHSVNFADTWDTTGAAPGGYRIAAQVLYESTATEPRVLSVRAGRAVYLPLILRELP